MSHQSNNPTTNVTLPRAPLKETPFVDVGGKSDVGNIRDKNTDFFLTAEMNRSLILGSSSLQHAPGTPWMGGTQGRLLVVADGITGAGLGEIASSVAVEGIAKYMVDVLPWVTEPQKGDKEKLLGAIKRGLDLCQERVEKEAKKHGYEQRPVGTTLTLAYLVWPYVDIVHVGDSRAYLYRDRRLLQLTSDDTVAQKLIEHHMLEPENVINTRFKHILTNSIGAGSDELEVEYHRYRLETGDQLMLCTDGLTRDLSHQDIKNALNESITAGLTCDRLIAEAKKSGGEDNITAVLARISGAN